jgi:ribonuclease HI
LPSSFKIGKIIVLRKPNKATYSDPSAFRPITLLSTLSKLLEGIISKRLHYELESRQLLTDSQYGFRQHRSCDLALLDLTENIRRSWDNNQVSSALLLDIKGAYDTVRHDQLMTYLASLGLPNYLLNWINDFLRHRLAYFTWAFFRSSTFPLHLGLPQGSPLSPILYICYNNILTQILYPIPRHIRLSFTLFADDITILSTGASFIETTITLQRCLDIIIRSWGEPFGQQFSFTKFQFQHYARGIGHRIQPNFIFQGHSIPPAKTVRCLGVLLTSTLTWNRHLSYVAERALSALKIYKHHCRVFRGLPLQTMLNLYRRAILPICDYAALVWCTWNPAMFKPLDTLQTKALRMFTGRRHASRKSLEICLQVVPPSLRIQAIASRRWLSLFKSPSQSAIHRHLIQRLYSPLPIMHHPTGPHKYTIPLSSSPLIFLATLHYPIIPTCLQIEKLLPPKPPWKALPRDTLPINIAPNKELAKTKWQELHTLPGIHLYSDGSVSAYGSGYGIFGSFPGHHIALKHRIPCTNTSFEAEMTGLYHAMLITIQQPVDMPCYLYSDSKSVLEALLKLPSRNSYRLHHLMFELLHTWIDNRRPFQITWIPGHSQIPGNDHADLLANQAITENALLSPYYDGVNAQLLRYHSQQILAANWTSQWQQITASTSDATLVLHSLFPDPLNFPFYETLFTLPKRTAQILIKLWTSDFFLGTSRHRLASIVLPTCLCNNSLDSLHHFLFECLDFTVQRQLRDSFLTQPASSVQQLLLRKQDFQTLADYMWSCCILHMTGQRQSHINSAQSTDPRVLATRVQGTL